MMEKKKNQVGFVLQGIKTEQFAILEENYSPKKEVGLNTGLQFKIDDENKQVATFIGFEFIQGKKVFLKIQVSCHFKIEEEAWSSFHQDKDFVIPKDFLSHLAMLTTGTARGILFAKTEGTIFSKYIVPTINVAEMIVEDVHFETKE